MTIKLINNYDNAAVSDFYIFYKNNENNVGRK